MRDVPASLYMFPAAGATSCSILLTLCCALRTHSAIHGRFMLRVSLRFSFTFDSAMADLRADFDAN